MSNFGKRNLHIKCFCGLNIQNALREKCRKLVLQSALRILAVPYCLLTLRKIADCCRKVDKFGEPSRDIGVVAGRVDLDRGVVDALQSLRALRRQIIPLRYL